MTFARHTAARRAVAAAVVAVLALGVGLFGGAVPAGGQTDGFRGDDRTVTAASEGVCVIDEPQGNNANTYGTVTYRRITGPDDYAFNTSTGTEEPYTDEGRSYLADTPNGRWELFWEVDRYRTSNLGRLYRPKYFHEDGIAVHGYSFVPPYAASHGCVRVSNPAIDFIWAEDLAPLHTPVWVYGTTAGR